MTIWNALNNPVTALIFMAAIGIAALLFGFRQLLDQMKGMEAGQSNVGDE